MSSPVIGTGLSGLVGSRIVQLLGDQFELVNLSLETGVDITDFELLKQKFSQLKEAKAVIHLAAVTDVDKAWAENGDKDGLTYRVNVLGTRNIARLCEEEDKYLIHLSTDFVFDGQSPPAGGYTEEDQPRPIEWYGQTKYWAEQEVERSGARNSILRIAFPYKARSAPKELVPKPKLDLVRRIKTRLEQGKEVKMFTDQIITPTFIDDISQVMARFLEVEPLGIFHCLGSTSLSPYDLANKVAEVFELDQSLINQSSLAEYLEAYPQGRPRQMKMILANSKLEEKLGIKMKTIDEGLQAVKEQLKLQ